MIVMVTRGKSKARTRRTFIVALLALITVGFQILHALDPHKTISQYKHSNWHLENGLPHVSVMAIEQTPDGYLWLGTLGGLARFDGVRFTVFNRRNTPQLQDNSITALSQSANGDLIVGTSEGGAYILRNGYFLQVPLISPGQPEAISAIFEDQFNGLWIGTSNNGLFHKKENEFVALSTRDGLANNRIRAIIQDSLHNLWIATDIGVAQKPVSRESLIPQPLFSEVVEDLLTTLCVTQNGEMWVGSYGGISRFGFSNGAPAFLEKHALKHTVKCVIEDLDQNLWVGTDGGGLMRLGNGKIDTFTTADGLASNFIHSLFEDRQRNLWIGSLDGGLLQLADTDSVIVSTREGLSHNVISNITEDRQGNIWVATKGGGVNRLNRHRVDLVLNSQNGLASDMVFSLAEDPDGKIWFGTDAGLCLYQHGQIKRFTTNDGLSSNQIYQIIQDRDGELWLVTGDKIHLFKDGRFPEYTPPSILEQKKIQYIYKQANGDFWFVIANGGLCAIIGDRVILYDESGGLVQNEVESMYENPDGVLYIGTRGGMSRIDKGKITNFTTQSGLMESQVRHIMEDRFGYLWLSGRMGIYRVARREVDEYAAGLVDRIHPMTFDQSDGIEQPWCESGIVTRDGKLWFTSYKGLVIIDPEKVGSHTSAPPQAIIEAVNVNGSPVDMYPKDGILTLPPGKKRIEFVYTAPTFYKPKKVKFHHKLSGYEKDWIDAGANRGTVYTGLGPGKYSFEVAASNPQGTWNKKSARLSFYIKPFFYQTIWFLLTMAAAIVLLTVFTYKLRTRQLRIREKTLSSLVESRTRELRESNSMIEAKNRQLQQQSEQLTEMDQIKSRFFANISHEFRTPLTLIMGPLERRIAEARDQHDPEELEMMARNSRRLLTLINQLLDLAKLESGSMRLQASEQDIVAFVRGIALSFESLLDQQHLTFEIATADQSIPLYFDGEKIEKIVSNLLSNAVKFTPSGGTITLTLSRATQNDAMFPRGWLELIIRDTGLGIPEDRLPYIFNHFYQVEGIFSHLEASGGSGIGLALVKELVELHRGDIAVKSAPGKGTAFTIRLPLGSGHLKPGEIVKVDQHGNPPNSGTSPLDTHEKVDAAPPAHDVKDSQPERDLVLVVEDNPDVRLYIRKALAPLFNVEEARNGAEGIEAARRSIPDLIVSDVMMPEVDGYTLCETLKKDKTTSHIPIILLTARAAEENVVAGLETGADDYVTKPFNTRILLTRMKNLIRLRRELQQHIQHELILQPEKIAVSSLDREFMEELKHILEKNLANPDFGVDELAHGLTMSRATLNRKLKAISGESTNRFIQSYRLKRAAQLLEDNFGNVTEVAFAVGFSSSAYFTHCFKEQFHKLPSDYKPSS